MKPLSFPAYTPTRELRAMLAKVQKAQGLAQLHGINRLVTCSLGHAHCGCSTTKAKAGKAECSVEVKAEFERRHAPGVRYLHLVWPGDLVLLRVPSVGDDLAIKPWKKVLKAVNVIREAAGVPWKDVFGIEDAGSEDNFKARVALAYGGATDILPTHTLYAWDSKTETFKLVRPAKERQ